MSFKCQITIKSFDDTKLRYSIIGSHSLYCFFSSFICHEVMGLDQRRQWHPTPVLLPEKSHGRKSLIGYSSWGPKESDTTERLHLRKFRRTITVKNQIFRNIFNLMSTKRKKKKFLWDNIPIFVMISYGGKSE